METYTDYGLRGNLLSPALLTFPREVIEVVLKTESFWLERIISMGQATPAGDWYDQDTHEWVLLLTGEAELFLKMTPK